MHTYPSTPNDLSCDENAWAIWFKKEEFVPVYFYWWAGVLHNSSTKQAPSARDQEDEIYPENLAGMSVIESSNKQHPH